MRTLLGKYREALEKAKADEKLSCHIAAIKSKIDALEEGTYNPTALDEVWIDYFLEHNTALPKKAMVRCCNCMAVFHEKEAVYDGEDDMDYCPKCGEGGFLVDISEFPSKEKLENLRETYKNGMMVELVEMNDPYTKLRPGDKGTIDHVDDAGGIHINWDSGSTLAAIWNVDKIKIL